MGVLEYHRVSVLLSPRTMPGWTTQVLSANMLQLCPQRQPGAAHASNTARMFSESLSDQPEKSTSLSVHPWVSGTDTGDEVIKRDKEQRTEHMCKRRHVAQLDTQWTSEMEQHESRGAQGDRASGVQ